MANWITGNVTWYDLCNCTGYCGACGNCNNSFYQAAWPELTTTGCYNSCGKDNPHACGDWIYVEDACTSNQEYGQITDCCPCSEQYYCNTDYACGGQVYYDPQWATPLADLTEAFFLYLHRSLADGRIPVWIWQ